MEIYDTAEAPLASVERGRRWRMRDEGELYLGCIHIIYTAAAPVYIYKND
jgi:hypothetical protein